jgi:hypothetical protein
VISEAAARRRDGRGQPYLVVFGDHRRPDALIEVNWSLDYLGTWFLDDKLRRNLKYSFTRVDAKTLFLEQIILWEYHEDAVRDLNTATKITTLTYNQDGVVHEAIDDSAAETVEVISRSDRRWTSTGNRSQSSATGQVSRNGTARADERRHIRTDSGFSTANRSDGSSTARAR